MKKRIHTIGKHGAIFFAGKHFDICAECGEPIDEGCRYLFRRFKKANKRADRWRGNNYKAIKQLNAGGFFTRVVVSILISNYEMKLESDLKQKKAWIAFYIATIFYIVGIIILI